MFILVFVIFNMIQIKFLDRMGWYKVPTSGLFLLYLESTKISSLDNIYCRASNSQEAHFVIFIV